MLTERDDAADAGVARALFEARELRIVSIEHGRAAGFDPAEYFRLGVGNAFDRIEEFKMYGLDRGDDRNMRAHHAGERLDFARVVHAHFEDCVLRRDRTTRK